MLPCHAVPALRGRVTVRLDALIRNVYRCTTRLDIGRDCLRSQRAEQPVGGSSGSARGCSTHTESTGSSNGAPRSPVTIVDTVRSAERAARVLASLPPSAHTAVDTEVAQLDVKRQSPVGNGELTCVSMFSGPEIDFGNGPRLWVDVLDSEPGTLDVFREFFLSESKQKVFHNYGFDRHILYNSGIDCHGLSGDTMHMARLWNTARARQGGYTLESLTHDLLGRRKAPMKELFGVPKLKKDGSPGKERVLAPVEVLQRDATTRDRWIEYSTYDAEGTWMLREQLEERLRSREWLGGKTMYDFYVRYIVPYAHVLTDMEREGIQVDIVEHLPAAQLRAIAERDRAENQFLAWASSLCKDAAFMNVSSDAQKAHFLFAPARRRYKRKTTGTASTASSATSWPRERKFKIDNTEGYIEPGKSAPKKQRDIVLRGIGLPASSFTAAGWPAVSGIVLRELAGEPHAHPTPRYGTAYEYFGGGAAGRTACEAIDALHTVSTVDTMLSNFILPLQEMADNTGRVHCSLNLNTETGRLSARRPNLQNQPALEKDRFKIRKAFTCRPGNALIVADYGQLELRLLAHMTKCTSMIEAFAAGGDFHSRTAMGMYPAIAADVAAGRVVLEGHDGTNTAPLLKDVYASERRRAKVLNFSIAYGKTAVGLSKDWGTTVEEARATLDAWYEDRPEVRQWQVTTKQLARRYGVTRTLMGRYRDLPMAASRSPVARGHAERAAINTPIQGGAADVVMMAMLKIARNQRLAQLGWRMLLQIHDEVILEGPELCAEEALSLVVADMEHPFEKPLLVDLVVDARSAKTWYDAK